MKKKLDRLANSNISARLGKSLPSEVDVKYATEKAVGILLDSLLIDWRNDHNMQDTPKRVAKMLVTETFAGRYMEPPKITTFPNVKGLDQIIAQGKIKVRSTCAHHMMPIKGMAWIGVMPKKNGRIVGLSKFNRVVDFYARRPQIQEEMTMQIADHLEEAIKPAGIIVIVRAQHDCVGCRGVNQDSVMTTSVARGKFRNLSIKAEFFSMMGEMKLE